MNHKFQRTESDLTPYECMVCSALISKQDGPVWSHSVGLNLLPGCPGAREVTGTRGLGALVTDKGIGFWLYNPELIKRFEVGQEFKIVSCNRQNGGITLEQFYSREPEAGMLHDKERINLEDEPKATEPCVCFGSKSLNCKAHG